MKNTTDYAAAAQKNETHAHAVIRKSGIIPAWKNIGAEINLVGSLKIGTLGKHPDIDFHTYTPESAYTDATKYSRHFAQPLPHKQASSI